MFLLNLFQGERESIGRPMKLDVRFWGIAVGRFKCGKMGVTIKRRNSLKMIPLKP